MNFVHAEADFSDLLAQVASARGLSPGLVEKDYWVVHVLWGLLNQGLDVWFKGGTSLSKGFGLIRRFSEDLDMKIEPGRATLPAVTDWRGDGTKAIAVGQSFFETLVGLLEIPGLQFEIDADSGGRWTAANIRGLYRGAFLESLDGLKPYILLEVGSARVTPHVDREITSFVHEELKVRGSEREFIDNHPAAVRCVHPLVTLVEKLDALQRRVPSATKAPATFVRHFEDAARIIQEEGTLPPLGEEFGDVSVLARQMLEQRQIRDLPAAQHEAFALSGGDRTDSIRRAFMAIGGLYWGPRLSLDESCELIRSWVRDRIERN